MTKIKPERATPWGSRGPSGREVVSVDIEHFDARGMRPLYGRGDHFGRRARHMDAWRTKDGRILARFWSRGSDVDSESHEVLGLRIPSGKIVPALADNEHLIPECLRDAYDKWVISEM